MDFNNIIAPLFSIGGIGYVNYVILLKTNSIDGSDADKNKQVAISLLFSIPNYIIYLIINYFLSFLPFFSNNFISAASLLLTMLAAMFATLKFGIKVSRYLLSKINNARKNNNDVQLDIDEPWINILGSDRLKPLLIYLYDFEYKPMGMGYQSEASNSQSSNYSLNLTPVEDDYQNPQPKFEELEEMIQGIGTQKKYEIKQHINFKQRFIMITMKKR